MADLWQKLVVPELANLLIAGASAIAAACLFRKNLLKYVLFVYAASFPLYINHSWRIHSSIFEFFTALLAACLLIPNIKNIELRNKINPVLMWFLFLFAAICSLSLMVLPSQELGKVFQWGIVPAARSIFAAYSFDPLYSIAAVNRLLLFIVFIAALSSRSDYETNYRSIFLGTLFGGLWSSLVGLLEYARFIDLSTVRSSINEGVRLQSVSGNAGWFAEYLTMTIPYILYGFLLKRGWGFKSLLLGVMILFEVTIILAGARGGWLAYPLTLLFCWLFFYLSKESASKKNLRGRLVIIAKVAVSIPLTIAVSMLLVLGTFAQIQKKFEAERKELPAWTHYVAPPEEKLLMNYKLGSIFWRYRNLFVPAGRVKIAQEGIAVWRERPIVGLGWETYRWHTGIMEQIQDSEFSKNRQMDMLLETPHNLYVQLLDGVGVAGLFIWLAMVFYGFVAGASNYFRNGVKTAVPVMLALFSFHQYGLTQDPPYIPVIWLLGFLNLGYLAALPAANIPIRVQKFIIGLACACCLIVAYAGFAYHSAWSSNDLAKKYGLSVYAKDLGSEKFIGFHDLETCGSGECRWAGSLSEVKLDMKGLFKIEYLIPAIEENKKDPIWLSFIIDGKIAARESGLQTGWRTRYLYADGMQNEQTLRIEASKVWTPKSLNTKSTDTRLLSVFVRTPLTEIDLTAQGGLVGLYKSETALDIPGWTEDEGPFFRWISGSCCAIELPPDVENIFIRNGHPNPTVFRTRAYVAMNGKKLLAIVLTTGEWVKCGVEKVESGKRIVTINLDRTWNPKRDGVAADDRELGIMVAIPGMR